jgi:ligand-binding SRPBCC domain-containing protein
MYQFKAEHLLPISLEDAWKFFSSPTNLPVITPPSLDFKILTPNLPAETYAGMIIDYKVRPLLGIQMHWKTEITAVNNNESFTDRQLKGPYKVWEHTHYFKKVEDGVLMTDIVNYELPLGILGKLAHLLIVKKEIENIFSYRKEKLNELFN